MNYKQRLLHLLNGQPVDRPPFLPAIYDLKPVLIDAPLHTFGQNENELINALRYEVNELQVEALTVGYDIYNIEAEAAGCIISRDPAIGMPDVAQALIHSLDETKKLAEFFEISGRMPLFISATQTAQQLWGDFLPVRAGISGPFSMAAKIYPQNQLLMDTLTNTEGLTQLLNYCTNVIKTYLKAYLPARAGIVVFDSFVSPPMISPESYRDLVLPFHQDIFLLLEKNNVLQRTLIVGGNTASLIPDFVKTGATQLLLDYSIPLAHSKEILQEYKNMVFRINLPPALFVSNEFSTLKDYMLNVLQTLRDCQNVIIGTGILPPNVLLQKIIKAKEILVEFYK